MNGGILNSSRRRKRLPSCIQFMKTPILRVLVGCWLQAGVCFGAAATNDIVGDWLGTIEGGPARLRILFHISRSPAGALTAKVDSPDQGARDLPVEEVSFKDGKLRLEVKMVQGFYEGSLDPQGESITGTWNQSGQAMPVPLRKTKGPISVATPESFSAADTAANKLAAQKLAGTWNGTLTAGPNTLRLRVKIASAASGAATGTLDSLDQGSKDIPVSGITLKDKSVRFEVRGILAAYDGTLEEGGSLIKGQWHQGGQNLPLDFKQTPPAR